MASFVAAGWRWQAGGGRLSSRLQQPPESVPCDSRLWQLAVHRLIYVLGYCTRYRLFASLQYKECSDFA
jgi:hypothetical protein